ncbi:hypothetical protein TRIUR3_12276 [Triticum urartu]|uniref:Uncharacterized protein n=1 Tax=Triticum urartu TaxID=4572 RepID=M7ZD03_TRIUA|nr:hypothetical protein TRIUR3_12276 [Triticum urartu]
MVVPKAFRHRKSSLEYRRVGAPPLYAELLALLVPFRDAQRKLRDSLDAPVHLLYDRFTGDVVVRSLRDVPEVRTNSRLLLNSANEPSHRITIVLDGLRTFSEANELRLHLLAGVDECGWRGARGLPQPWLAWTSAGGGWRGLKAALEKVHTADVYNAAADQDFQECRARAAKLRYLFDGDLSVVSSGAHALLLVVDDLVRNQLHNMLFPALEQLDILCTEDVSFIQA